MHAVEKHKQCLFPRRFSTLQQMIISQNRITLTGLPNTQLVSIPLSLQIKPRHHSPIAKWKFSLLGFKVTSFCSPTGRSGERWRGWQTAFVGCAQGVRWRVSRRSGAGCSLRGVPAKVNWLWFLSRREASLRTAVLWSFMYFICVYPRASVRTRTLPRGGPLFLVN